MDRKRAFDPVVRPDTRVLILGSLPGDASLKAGQYYGHPRNAFWRLIGEVVGRDLAGLPYSDRLDALMTEGIGVWDVIATAHRRGSLDTAIRDPETADLRTLISGLPALRAVAFNGGTAARIGRKSLIGPEGPHLIDLPSSSPAYTRPFAAKAEAWSALKAFLAA